MVEFFAAALIVSGFWMLLELARFLLQGLEREPVMAEISAGPGRDYVERYADAFSRLAESYQEMPKQKEHLGDEEVESIFDRVHGEVCTGCFREERCWQEQYYESCSMVYGCLRKMERGEVTENDLGKFGGYCCRAEEYVEQLGRIFRQERINLLWNNRLLEQRAAAGEQIMDTAALLKQMSERIYRIQGLKEKERKKLDKELRYEKIQCQNAWIFRREETYPELYVTMRMNGGSCMQAKDVADIMSKAMGRRMVAAGDCRLTIKKEYDTYHYVTDTEYQMFCGIARMTKTGELVSGDSFAFWQGERGQVIMSLADGMGSGVEACQESEKVIELLEKFLDAGFSQETAVRMINSSMVLQDHHRIFSTIDLCMVDLYNGKCDIIKAGASATYLKRGDTLESIRCQTLPAGVVQAADYERTERQLISGDMIIMMTDGVADAFLEKGREAQLEQLILKTKTNNAKEFARRLLEQILLKQQMQVRDDMTVLVGKIWDK
ncbi:MAG: SpoIIE family protein phosphatase [Lachnospiraceae bacterium]|nr:SpoIIE family protein phosphatase [Lachnospiraceae bacterium]